MDQEFDFIPYERFGVNFVEHAVTAERIAKSIEDVAGDGIEVGPMQTGPGGLASVKATGRIGTVVAARSSGPELRFHAIIPMDLDLEVKLAGVPNRYSGSIEVPLRLSVKTAEPLMLVIEIGEVSHGEVVVDLKSFGIGAEILQRIGGIDEQVRRQVARQVNQRLSSQRSAAARMIDVGALIEMAMQR
jgi:hypothetical protein